jgi:hypothetical protein
VLNLTKLRLVEAEEGFIQEFLIQKDVASLDVSVLHQLSNLN